MTINSDEYRSVVGLDDLYVAAVTADSASGYTAGTPQYLAPAAEASQEPSVATETVYADNQPYDTVTARGQTKVSLTITGLPASMYALLTGGVFDAASGRVWDNEGTPPYYALGFRAKKSNGSYRYVWFLKGTFEPPKEDAATQNDKPDIKKTSLVYTAIKTIYKFELGTPPDDSLKRVFGDEDTDSFSATDWFTQVQTPTTVSVSALALSSSVPTDDLTGVSRTANQTLTFNNALADDAIYSVALLDASLATVASAISLDTAKKVVTINPNATLGDTVVYTLVYAGVTDIYGQHLTGQIQFTTSS